MPLATTDKIYNIGGVPFTLSSFEVRRGDDIGANVLYLTFLTDLQYLNKCQNFLTSKDFCVVIDNYVCTIFFTGVGCYCEHVEVEATGHVIRYANGLQRAAETLNT